jgi:hypothetical protein
MRKQSLASVHHIYSVSTDNILVCKCEVHYKADDLQLFVCVIQGTWCQMRTFAHHSITHTT